MTTRAPGGAREALSTQPVQVSVLVPVLNEARHIRAAVEAMRAQRVDGELELLFIDGGSTDGTREILRELAAEDPRVRMLENPARLIPNGLNVGLQAARGEFVARMDAHSFYPPDYLATGIERLRRGDADWVSGPQLAHGERGWSRRTAMALRSRLGVGGATFRIADREIESDAGYTGVWRRSTLEAHGGWDEGWPVNEDGELAARIRAAGGRILCVPEMAARYVPRDSLRALAHQYWRYGQYRAKTLGRHPRTIRRSHVLAPGLAMTTLASLLGPRRLARPARAGLVAYALALAGASVRAPAADRRDAAWLPAVWATMHLAWGYGFLAGCLRFGPPLEAFFHALRLTARGAVGARATAAPRPRPGASPDAAQR